MNEILEEYIKLNNYSDDSLEYNDEERYTESYTEYNESGWH